MQLHSRARVLQSRQRAERLRRKNLALAHLLEVAQAQRHIEIDLRRIAERASIKTKAKITSTADVEIDLRRTPLRDIDLRRVPERKPTILINGQPRSALSTRRWGGTS